MFTFDSGTSNGQCDASEEDVSLPDLSPVSASALEARRMMDGVEVLSLSDG